MILLRLGFYSLLLAIVAATVKTLPDIQRYLKIRAM